MRPLCAANLLAIFRYRQGELGKMFGGNCGSCRAKYPKLDCGFMRSAVFEEIPQSITAARMSEFPQRFRFDLANTLSSHCEILADFFESMFASILETEAHFDDLLFSWTKCLQDLGGLFAKV